LTLAVNCGDARFEVVDLTDSRFHRWTSRGRRIMGQYNQPHTHMRAAKIASFKAYVFVTPEYKHSAPGRPTNLTALLVHSA
jgi:NAD(P)H-dependent FMN reductase